MRLEHGDANPKGPGIKEIVIETPANNDYSGRRQALPLGSYAIVPDNGALRISGSFTFTAWIAPTSQRGDGTDVFSGVEGILTKAGGYAVVIDEAGRLSLWLTAADGRTEKIAAGQPLRTWVPAIPGMNARPQGVTTVWSFVAVSFDAASGTVVLHQDPLNDFPFDASRGVSERRTTVKAIATSAAPLLLAALRDSSGKITGHFNGKIDNPRLYRRVLSPQEIGAIAQGRGPTDALASWDFSIDIETDRISDTSSNELHGSAESFAARETSPCRARASRNTSGRGPRPRP